MGEVEIWKDVVGYDGCYVVSNLGMVRSTDRVVLGRWGEERILKGRCMGMRKNYKGYLSVHLSKNSKGKQFRVNRLVAQAFIPNPENKPEVGHIFGNKEDNRACSLNWETRLENMKHASRTGLMKARRGEASNKAKLTEKQVLEIRSSKLTPKQMSIIYNVTRSSIDKIIAKINWKHI